MVARVLETNLDRRILEIKGPPLLLDILILCGLQETDDTRSGSKLFFEVVFIQSVEKLSIAGERYPRR